MLKQQGESVGRYKAGSLMREAGLVSKQLKRYRYRLAQENALVVGNKLARQFNVARADQVWCGDVTYVWSGRRWFYLAVVIDLYRRRVVGWACSNSPDSALTVRAPYAWRMNRERVQNRYCFILIRVAITRAVHLDNNYVIIKLSKA